MPASKSNDEWISYPPLPPPPPATQPENIQLQFEHYQTEISMPGHVGV
jgi:hypothetical protein